MAKQHLCKSCGEANLNNFYKRNKSYCKACLINRRKQYYTENAESISKKTKQYYIKNSEHIKNKNKEYYRENSKYVKEYRKEYYKENKESILEKGKQYKRERRKVDPGFKYIGNLRKRQNEVLKGVISTTEGLGCNTQELRDHLESLFTEGMTHDNYGKGPGKWNIDHKDPISLLQTGEDGEPIDSEYNRKLIHYTNMQPLWEEDNLKKSNKVFSKTLD